MFVTVVDGIEDAEVIGTHKPLVGWMSARLLSKIPEPGQWRWTGP